MATGTSRHSEKSVMPENLSKFSCSHIQNALTLIATVKQIDL